LTFVLIDLLAPSPVSRPEDPDDVTTICEPDSHHAAIDPAETVIPLFARAVREVFRDHAARIRERELRPREPDAVLPLVLLVLVRVPLEPDPRHHGNPSMRLD
jgi:hypothetical protein